MIDFHCHILPSIDDGPIDVDESIAMAHSLADFGYKVVCCTPHCLKGFYDLTPQQVREATLMLQADLDNSDIHHELWPGIEYMLDEYFNDYARDLMPIGETRLVLCEAPQKVDPDIVFEGLDTIIRRGYVPLIAHPERSQFFYDILTSRNVEEGARREVVTQKPGGFLKRLFSPRATDRGTEKIDTAADFQSAKLPKAILYHANLGSFTGYYGADAQRRGYELLKMGVYTGLASDLHDARTMNKVLQRDKFETNPLLMRLTEWDGTVSEKVLAACYESGPQGEQKELF